MATSPAVSVIPTPKEIAVTLKASAFFYDAEHDAYRVKFNDSRLIANDAIAQTIVLLIPSSKVQSSSQTQCFQDEDIDTILDEIADKEHHKKSTILFPSGTTTAATNNHHAEAATSVSRKASSASPSVVDEDHKDDREDSPPCLSPTTHPLANPDALEHKLASIPKPRKSEKLDDDAPSSPPLLTMAPMEVVQPPSPMIVTQSSEAAADAHTLAILVPSKTRKQTSTQMSHGGDDLALPEHAGVTPVAVPATETTTAVTATLESGQLTTGMKKEWLACCDTVSADECRGDNGAGCVAMKRVKFVLHQYADWIKHKSGASGGHDSDHDDGDSSDGESSDGDDDPQAAVDRDHRASRLRMRSYEWMTDFFADLGVYSYVELSDDFEHIRDCHMKLNKNKTTQTIEYFDANLGKCGDKECACLSRHCRDRHVDNINEMKRRQIFFIKDDDADDGDGDDKKSDRDRSRGKSSKSKSKKKKKIVRKNTVKENKMYGEINLQTKLDTMHITLRHHHLRLINTDKFITKIYASEKSANASKSPKKSDRGKSQKSDRGKSAKSEKSETAIASAETEEDDDIFCRMTKYSFGESITYWDGKHHRYCDSKYADLRSELLHNKIYPLSLDLYNTIKNRAVSFLATRKGQKITAQREHDWMKKWKILRHSTITVDHVIALLCYVNVTALRRVFKLHGFVRAKTKNPISISLSKKSETPTQSQNPNNSNSPKYESRDLLLERHREIWHWSRLLLECVHCYGIPLNQRINYYHGIDCKLLFNRFNVMFDIPTSLTLNRDIAYNLSRTINYGRGIAIELSHGGLSDLQSLCLDLSYLSDYPSEEEQLVFHSYLSFNDIIINRMHHDEWLKILRFWYKIKEGFFFNHLIESDKITRNDQLCICAMIINMIIADTKHPRYDTRIPLYMQKLFNECVENNTFVWIIQSEYRNMIKKLQSLLYFDHVTTPNSSQFVQYLIKYKECNVCNSNIFEWQISGAQFEDLFDKSKKNKWIVSPPFTVCFGDAESDLLQFHFEAQNKPKNNLFRCRIHLDDKPENVAKINLGMGLFCKEANDFDNYSYGELRHDKLYNVSLHSLFQTKILKKNCANKTFTLKLQIQLFYMYDFKGKLIPINQSQIGDNTQYFD